MNEAIITVENLGKKYSIAHQSGKGGYTSLRDVLSEKARAGISKLKFRNRKANAMNSPNGGHSWRSKSPSIGLAASEDFWAIEDVSFEVRRGEVVGIIGRNGAGKSTLLKILSRITEPTTGRVRLRGRVASLLEVGTGFHPELTGRENIFLNGAILGMKRAEIRKKFDEIVAFAEVETFLDTPVKRYSSGMYVRLAFAVAAHLEPEILIVDEVLAVGDAEFQKKCLGKMQEVSTSQGRTVLFVSHQLVAVRRLCTSACLLKNGRTSGIMPVESAIGGYTASMKASSFDQDLGAIPRQQDWGESARICRLTVPPDSSIKYGEPLAIVVVIQCFTAVSNAVIGIGFDTLDGYRIMTIASDNNMPTFNLAPGIHEIRLEVDRNPLHPSTFSCGVALFSGRLILDALTNCATWEVSPSRLDVASARGFSGCRPAVKVSVSPVLEKELLVDAQ